jgi:hypothetical protein
MRTTVHDPDLLLVEQLLAPPPLEDARRSLDFWRGRRRSLPVYRRTARREADAMVARWQERVRAAERARFEATLVGRVLGRLWPAGLALDRRAVAAFAWRRMPRRLKLVAYGFVAACLAAVVVAIALVALTLNAIA